ncbi:MAG: ParA family protein [Turicibacter sp.]|nr:ParA family protein [Turicibacter sp.]
MKTTNIINLKGGVGKTISAINIAYTLATKHNQRTLLIDNDKQANVSKFFGLHGDDVAGIAELLTQTGKNRKSTTSYIKPTQYDNLSIITSNMGLLQANRLILIDTNTSQQTRLKKALEQVASNYDYCIIDNPLDMDMGVINALVAGQDVLIPMKMDKFAFDGLKELRDVLEGIEEFNPKLNLRGCFITMQSATVAGKDGERWLRENSGLPVFAAIIRKTVKVDESTFSSEPLALSAHKQAQAAADYEALVAEYLSKGE